MLRLLVYTGGVLDDQHDNLFTIGEYGKSLLYITMYCVVWPRKVGADMTDKCISYANNDTIFTHVYRMRVMSSLVC